MKAYLIRPPDLMELFESEEEFVEWLRLGDVESLEATLNAFEFYELYRECSIILEELNKKKKDAKH